MRYGANARARVCVFLVCMCYLYMHGILEIKIVPFISIISIKKDSVGTERMNFYFFLPLLQHTSQISLHMKSFSCSTLHLPLPACLFQFLNFKFSRQFSVFNWNISIVSNEWNETTTIECYEKWIQPCICRTFNVIWRIKKKKKKSTMSKYEWKIERLCREHEIETEYMMAASAATAAAVWVGMQYP